MANRNTAREGRQPVYYLLPAEGVQALLGSQGCPLGPLAEPEPEPAIIPAPEPTPSLGPSYGPRQAASEPQAAPRGFFLDRYVY